MGVYFLDIYSVVPNTCNRIVQSNTNVEYLFCLWVLGSNPGSATATLAQLGDISFQLGIYPKPYPYHQKMLPSLKTRNSTTRLLRMH